MLLILVAVFLFFFFNFFLHTMTNASPPVWAALPDGRQLNVAPLLNLLHHVFDATPQQNSTDGVLNIIRQTIRTLNLANHAPDLTSPNDLINLYVDLYRLEDMFAAMTDQPIEETAPL
jgi:hypothetical protein